MKHLLSFFPVILATVYFILLGVGIIHGGASGALPDALVVIAGILGFSFLSGRAVAGDQLDRMEDSARLMRDAMGDAEALRKVMQRFLLLQQTAGEALLKLQEGVVACAARVEAIDGSRVRDLSTAEAQAQQVARLAAEAERTTLEGLLDAYDAVWMNAKGKDGLVAQLALQLEVPLRRAGITIFAETNIRLDGERHKRVDDESVDDVRDGLVVHVYKPGYLKNGRVVRQALVRVGRVAEAMPQHSADDSALPTVSSTSYAHQETDQ